MSKLLLSFLVVVATAVISTPAVARRGADDGAGQVSGDDRGRGGDRVRTGDDRRGGDRIRVGGGGRNDRTGDAPRVNGEDGGVHQCRGCDDPTSGRNRDRSVPSTDD